MVLSLLRDVNVHQGLEQLADSAYSMRQNMDARVETPVLDNGDKLWDTWLDSKTMVLYGGVNEDGKNRFKIDNEFDIGSIVDSSISGDGSISLDESVYMQSQGTEFVIIDKEDLKGAQESYAIRSDKYEGIKDQLNKGNYKVASLEKEGGFKINTLLTPDEVVNHDGWRELAVGKNNASEDEYQEAVTFLKEKYVPEAKKNDCFGNKGMGFYVQTDKNDFGVRPLFVYDSIYRVGAGGRDGFGNGGRFLRVKDASVASHEVPEGHGEQNIDYVRLASDLGNSDFDPAKLGVELNQTSFKNIALSQIAYVNNVKKE